MSLHVGRSGDGGPAASPRKLLPFLRERSPCSGGTEVTGSTRESPAEAGLSADPLGQSTGLGGLCQLLSVRPSACQGLLEGPQRWGGVRELPLLRPWLSLVP